jgi:hypothetical protein
MSPIWPTHRAKARKRLTNALYLKKRGRRERRMQEGGKRG